MTHLSTNNALKGISGYIHEDEYRKYHFMFWLREHECVHEQVLNISYIIT